MSKHRDASTLLAGMPEPSEVPKQGEARFVESIMYTFFAPLVVYPGWEDTFRDRKMEAIAQRVKHQKDVFQEEQCTEYEAMLYVSSATLVAPPEHDWVQVYLWLFQRYRPDVAEANDLKPDRPELNAQQAEMLTRLRCWVFRRQMEHLKRKTKDEQVPTKEPKESKQSKESEVEVIQERMF